MKEKIIKRNKEKWTTLPAGKKRKSVFDLLKLSDAQLISEYKRYIAFWEKERGWEYITYSKILKNKVILEIGSGLGYDGIKFSKYVKKWVFSDIIPENLQFIKRVAHLFNVKNVEFEYLDNITAHVFPESYDVLYAHGVLHHIPFELAKEQVKNIDIFLKPSAKVICLMYPKERWEHCGCPDFTEFGKFTDGEDTPWAEWYDEEKIQKLFGVHYKLIDSKRWGWKNIEFINFVLEKQV